MKNFDDVFKIYNSTFPATKAEDHKPNQVREKYTEIIEAAGLDGRLLPIDYSKETRTVSECLKSCTEKTVYVIPDESVDFVVSVIKKHISNDYKHIRRGDFKLVSKKELLGLVEGFTKMLFGLGYPLYIIIEQREAIEKRFYLKIHGAMDDIVRESNSLIKDAELRIEDFLCLNRDDRACFLSYMASAIAGLREHLAEVYSAYSDTRSEELSKHASIEAENISMEDIELDYQESELIAHDDELQELIRERDKIIGSYGFVKSKRKEYAVVNVRIQNRMAEHHKTVYGCTDFEEKELTLKHPTQVLHEAVTYVNEESNEAFENFNLNRLAKSREQIDFESAEAGAFIKKMEENFKRRREESQFAQSNHQES